MKSYSISISFALLFLFALIPQNISSGESYPYNLEHFEDLGIDDARRCSFSDDGKLIVYNSNEEKPDYSSIWVANVDGTNKVMVYRNSSIDDTFTGPEFSPDGNSIVFTKRTVVVPSEKVDMSIEVLRHNGTRWDYTESDEIYLVHNNGLEHPSFSPDGNKIVYFSNEAGGDGDVWIMDVDGSNRTQLTTDEKGGGDPSVSPDGEKIVYTRWSENGENEIWIMDTDGSNRKMICEDSWHPGNPSFMPDGKIIFEAARLSPHSVDIGAPSVWTMDQDGGNRILLAPYMISSIGSNSPAINSDGTKIIFENGFGDDFTLCIVEDPDGDGEWEDSDGDRVADICDGFPDDPDRGYITDKGSDDSPAPGVALLAPVIAACAWVWRRSN